VVAQLARVLRDDEIIVIMRERTAFPESLFDRLPRLRQLVTTGFRNASIDLSAAARHGVTVCGTASGSRPPAELTWALILGLARNLVAESVAAALRRSVADRDRHRSRRRHARAAGARPDRC
jgi:phosphoglycerate dehydrogenase-like enzyme